MVHDEHRDLIRDWQEYKRATFSDIGFGQWVNDFLIKPQTRVYREAKKLHELQHKKVLTPDEASFLERAKVNR